MRAKFVNEAEITISVKRIQLIHKTDNDMPEISTNPERLIPFSISCNVINSYRWLLGENTFSIYIKPTTTFLFLDIKKDDFWNFGSENDSPIIIGRKIYKYAIDKGIDIIKIKNVPQVGTEYAIINTECIETIKKI